MADDGSFDTGYAKTGAGLGATVGSFVPVVGTAAGGLIGGALGLGIGGVKYLLGAQQRRESAAIKPYNPGYEVNKDVIDNARITGDTYNNYLLPGYQQILSNLNSGQTNSQVNAERGATSSADVIAAANVGNQIHANQLGQLAIQNAQGKESALSRYLTSKAAAGAEYANKNVYDREQYNQQLQLKNQLNNNATANEYGAADQTAKLISSIFSYRGATRAPGPTGKINVGEPIFSNDDLKNVA